jgi:3-deoxy-manno-octulosonate cytidylyltransferase (CMP-KDO synthetase)
MVEYKIMTHIAIIIPARYGSKRFPGKPLALLRDKEVLGHVIERARIAAKQFDHCTVLVATDDDRIAEYCRKESIDVVLTSADLATGTDRVLVAAESLTPRPDIILNLQGDAPFVYEDMIAEVIEALHNNPQFDIATPVTQMTWARLDKLRNLKKATPFSGTTVIRATDGSAVWFSKSIIPALKSESKIRKDDNDLSPVFRHIGLYAFRYEALKKFAELPSSHYEDCEELEQLRALENGMNILTVAVDYKGRPAMTGIDSPEDLIRAEALLKSMMGV